MDQYITNNQFKDALMITLAEFKEAQNLATRRIKITPLFEQPTELSSIVARRTSCGAPFKLTIHPEQFQFGEPSIILPVLSFVRTHLSCLTDTHTVTDNILAGLAEPGRRSTSSQKAVTSGDNDFRVAAVVGTISANAANNVYPQDDPKWMGVWCNKLEQLKKPEFRYTKGEPKMSNHSQTCANLSTCRRLVCDHAV